MDVSLWVTRKHHIWTVDTERRTTVVHGVGQSHGLLRVNEGDVEDCFHSGLIKAGEGFPGIRRLHLSRGHNSVNSRYDEIRRTD